APASSSASIAPTPLVIAVPAAPDSDWPSCRPSPRPTTARSAPPSPRGRGRASSSRSAGSRRRDDIARPSRWVWCAGCRPTGHEGTLTLVLVVHYTAGRGSIRIMRITSPPPPASAAPDVTGRVRMREAGLRLARRVQYWIAAAAIGAAGALAALTAHGYHARAATPPTTAPGAATASPSRPQPDNGAPGAGSTTPGPALQPPVTVPSPAPATNVAPVVSG